MNLKMLSSDNAGFKLWYEKFVNTFEATIRGVRQIFELITKEIDQGDILEDDELEEWYELQKVHGRLLGENPELAWDEFGEKVSFVLVDKCEGDARLRIRTKKMDKASHNLWSYTNGSWELQVRVCLREQLR